MAEVVIYTTHYCPYCRAAKNLLKGKGIEFSEINVEGDPEKRFWLAQTTGQKTVPQIFINEKLIGGYQELAELERSGRLDKIIGITQYF